MNKLNIMLALRNLLRQKRRNLLLGLGITIGMTVLVMVNSFSHGISDILLNKVIVNVAGHIQVTVTERGRSRNSIIRDRDRMIRFLTNNLVGVRQIRENVGTFVRALGNEKSDNMVIAGIYPDKGFEEYLKITNGKFSDMTNASIENPIILSGDKARDLNVKVYDKVRVRLNNIRGNAATASLTVVAITRPDNMFMSMVCFARMDQLKALLGLRPQETGSLLVMLRDPKSAIIQANLLHEKLKPHTALITGSLGPGGGPVVTLMGFKTNNDAIAGMDKCFKLERGAWIDLTNKDSVAISLETAKKLGARIGDRLAFVYQSKFDGAITDTLQVRGLFNASAPSENGAAFLFEEKFYDIYYQNLPPDLENQKNPVLIATNSPCYASLSPEWTLLKRSATTDEVQKKMQEVRKLHLKGAVMDVNTMYEVASAILSLESGLNTITLIVFLVLFLVILVGVINTLRMTIRERTREIGTTRAIGMQSRDVQGIFILETIFLAFFACVAGVVFGFINIGWISILPPIKTDSPLSILLVNGRLYFLANVGSIVFNTVLILLITLLIAFLTTRRAARLRVADALRHFE